MKKYLLSTLILLLSVSFFAQSSEPIPAFPGAEGFGKNATGGRGGRVIEVTNLLDYAEKTETPIEGSLRYALKTQGDDPITIIFRVSGMISLKERLKCGRSNMTIAGQTAPGDGICISGENIYFSGKNFIIRYLRFRIGDELASNQSCVNIENAENFIVDHCSFSWSSEENMTVYDNKYSTVQWCIISEPLYKSTHPKGSRGYGMQWGGQYASYHHNLIAHAYSRAPRVNGSRAHDTMSINDFVNNVIYNWGKKNSVYGGELELEGGVCHINWENNYYKPGPATPKNSYFAEISYTQTDKYGKWYVNGNYMEGYPAINEDNTKGVNYKGGIENHRADVRFEVEDVITTTAQEAYVEVLSKAGARLPKLDAIDLRILAEAKGDIDPVYGGVLGANKGIIDTQAVIPAPTYKSEDAPIDSDGDGIPDEWELQNGLDPNELSDGAQISNSAYSNLENYLNSIVENATSVFKPEYSTKSSQVYYDNAQQILFLNSTECIENIAVYQSNGALIEKISLNSFSANIRLKNLNKGFYIVFLHLKNNKSDFHKIIIN